jgi:hypothetical protein
MIFRGTHGDDNLTGTSGDDTFNLTRGGNDTADGGGGNDVFWMGAALNAADKIDGGTGDDRVNLNGDYSAGLTFSATTMVNVEELRLAGGHSYGLVMNDANVATGERLTVMARSLGAGDHLTFDGSAEQDGHFEIFGGAGDDTITGGAKGDRVHFENGGNDTVHSGGGGDTIYMGGAMTSTDVIDGGAGSDTVVLDGFYDAGLVFGATTMTNVETLVLTAGNAYNLTTNDATVAANQTLTLDASQLAGQSDSVVFDGRAETDGSFHVIAGAAGDFFGGGGNDTFDLANTTGLVDASGEGGNDTFNFTATFKAADQIDGGAGNDTLHLDGDYSMVFNDGTIQNIDNFVMAAGHDYSFITFFNNVADGDTMTVDASAVTGGNTVTFDGANEQTGNFHFIAGAHGSFFANNNGAVFDLQNSVTVEAQGAAGACAFNFAGNLVAADIVNGGAGDDTIALDGDYSAGLVFGATTLTHVETMILGGGFSYNLTTNEATVAADGIFEVDATGLHAGDTLTFNGSAETDGFFNFSAGAGTYDLTGGGRSDQFDMGAHFTAADHVDGGAAGGDDTMTLNGGYTGANALVFGAATLVNISVLGLNAGHSYDITTTDGNVASGTTLNVAAGALGSGDTLVFDGSAETDGHFLFGSGSGSDTLTGGALSDTFDYEGITLSGATRDTVNQFQFGTGATHDTVQFAAVSAIDTEVVAGSLSNATFDADLAAAIGAGQLGAGHAVLFDPSSGSEAGHLFLIVDGNGVAGYQAGFDLVINLTDPGSIGSIATADFVA